MASSSSSSSNAHDEGVKAAQLRSKRTLDVYIPYISVPRHAAKRYELGSWSDLNVQQS